MIICVFFTFNNTTRVNFAYLPICPLFTEIDGSYRLHQCTQIATNAAEAHVEGQKALSDADLAISTAADKVCIIDLYILVMYTINGISVKPDLRVIALTYMISTYPLFGTPKCLHYCLVLLFYRCICICVEKAIYKCMYVCTGGVPYLPQVSPLKLLLRCSPSLRLGS